MQQQVFSEDESGSRQRKTVGGVVAPSPSRRRLLSHPTDAHYLCPIPSPPLQAEAGAPDVLARLSNACAKIGGNDASKLAPVACLALELLFTLERCRISPSSGRAGFLRSICVLT